MCLSSIEGSVWLDWSEQELRVGEEDRGLPWRRMGLEGPKKLLERMEWLKGEGSTLLTTHSSPPSFLSDSLNSGIYWLSRAPGTIRRKREEGES